MNNPQIINRILSELASFKFSYREKICKNNSPNIYQVFFTWSWHEPSGFGYIFERGNAVCSEFGNNESTLWVTSGNLDLCARKSFPLYNHKELEELFNYMLRKEPL